MDAREGIHISLVFGPLFTPSQVNRAGSIIRKSLRGQLVEQSRMAQAYELVEVFRAAHQYPLIKANNGLRSMIKTEHAKVEVSQRLKRFNTIVDKLEREPTLALASMQDIGGCRALLGNIDEIRRVEARLKKNRPVVGCSDYIATPRSSGYRGVHVIVDYDGRSIEIQLRTPAMHAWAIAVERQSERLGHNLKGDGHHAVQDLMAVIANALAIEEGGEAVPPALQEEIRRRRIVADPYLEGTRT